ncbi:MAG: branched-chain amino acid transaminase [Proteobacteria bacterium]|nr:branched-chain amino acid transaminase [Pseudomonadota bacterium]
MNFADRDGFIWMDGAFTPWRDAKIHVLTHTLHYGMGAYEGIRAYETNQGTSIFRLHDHIARLFSSAKIFNMPMPYEPAILAAACVEILQKNNLSAAYIRPVIFYGSEGMGLRATNLKTHVAIAAWSWGEYLGDGSLENGIRIKTSSYVRNYINSLPVKAKGNGHYVNSMLALQEALACGYDEALMLDHQGFVAEGSGENFFMIKKGIIYTPPLACILDGITRDTVCQLVADMGLSLVEKNITRDEVYLADEAFFTGTAAEVTPIRELDGRVIGSGKRGEITTKIQALFFDQVYARRKEHPEWLTFVK